MEDCVSHKANWRYELVLSWVQISHLFLVMMSSALDGEQVLTAVLVHFVLHLRLHG